MKKVSGFTILLAVLAVVLAWFTHRYTAETKIVPSSPASVPNPASNRLPQAAPPIGGRLTCSGHVLSTHGNAIPSARVELKAGEESVQSVTSNDQGEFSLPEFTYRPGLILYATADGYAPANRAFEGNVNLSKSVEFFLKPLASIAGVVQNAEGKPLQGFVVSGKGQDGFKTASRPTEDKGLFLLEEFEGGEVRLWASFAPATAGKSEYARDQSVNDATFPTITLQKGERLEGVIITLPLSSMTSVAGKVVDPEGKPIANARVEAASAQSMLTGFGQSDAQGAFAVDNLVYTTSPEEEVSEIHLLAVHPDFAPTRVNDIPTGSTNVVITMKPLNAGELIGIVLDKKTREPVTKAQVCMVSNRLGSGPTIQPSYVKLREAVTSGKLKVDGEGKFRIPNVGEGTAVLLVYAKGYGLTVTEPITVTQDRENPVEILLEQGGKLRVNLSYSGDMEGREAALQINCRPEGSTIWEPFSGPAGEGVFTGEEPPGGLVGPQSHEMTLPAGRYQLCIWTQVHMGDSALTGGFNHATYSAQVRAGETTNLDVTLGGTGLIQGSMPHHDGEKREFLFLAPGTEFPPEAIECAGNPYKMLGFTNGAGAHTRAHEGRYEFNCLPEGVYTVGAFALSEADNSVVQRGFRTVEIKAGSAANVDFP